MLVNMIKAKVHCSMDNLDADLFGCAMQSFSLLNCSSLHGHKSLKNSCNLWADLSNSTRSMNSLDQIPSFNFVGTELPKVLKALTQSEMGGLV